MTRNGAVAAVTLALLATACAANGELDQSGDATTTAVPPTAAPLPSTPAETTASPPTTAALPVPVDLPCPEWDVTVTGQVPAAVPELSGLATSVSRPDVLWAHNDSGDTARLFALTADGAVLTEVTVGGLALDWEDVATAAAGDGSGVVWVADTGDNLLIRPSVTLVRVPEPDLTSPPENIEATGAAAVEVTYAGDEQPDVETLLADPATGDLLLVAKDATVAADGTRTSAVYRVAVDDAGDGEAEAERAGEIVVPDERFGPTGGTVSADGSLVVVRTATTALVWPSSAGVGVLDRLAAQPDAPCRFELPAGEAVAASPDGRQLTAASEGEGSDILQFTRL